MRCFRQKPHELGSTAVVVGSLLLCMACSRAHSGGGNVGAGAGAAGTGAGGVGTVSAVPSGGGNVRAGAGAAGTGVGEAGTVSATPCRSSVLTLRSSPPQAPTRARST
jgi:hypothetical protein